MISKAKSNLVLLFLFFTWICLLSLALASSQSFLFWHYYLYNVQSSQLEKIIGVSRANKSQLGETCDMWSYFIIMDISAVQLIFFL